MRPTPIQLSQLQAAAHKAVDRIILAHITISRRAHEMSPGVSGPRGGPRGRGDHTDPTALTALGDEQIDPSLTYTEWLATFNETLAALWTLDDRGARLAATKPRASKPPGDICAECQTPAVVVKRIDGEPYCIPCYKRVGRAQGCVR